MMTRSLSGPALTLALHLASLESSGLIHLAQLEPVVEYVFRHALVRDAAYNALLKTQRAVFHLAVGETMEQADGGLSARHVFLPLLAQHFYLAGDGARALKYFTLAGDAAVRVYANVEAVMHYTRALEVARPEAADLEQLRHVYGSRGRALELSGQFEQALKNYEDMEAVARQRGDRSLELAALTARTTLQATPTPLFDPSQGQPLAERTLALARQLGDRLAEARVLWNLLLLNYHGGRLAEAVEYGEQSLAVAQEFDLREQLAFTQHNLGMAYLAVGETERGRQLLALAEGLWRVLVNKHMLAENIFLSGKKLYTLGDFGRAQAAAQVAYTLSHETNNLWIQTCCGWVLGNAYVDSGQIDLGIKAFEAAISIGQHGGFSLMEAILQADLGWLHARLGNLEQGLELARIAAGRAKAEEWPPEFRAWVTAILASVQIHHGNLTAAEATLAEAKAGLDRRNLSTPAPIVVAWVETELAIAHGQEGVAGQIVDAALDVLRRAGWRVYLPHTLLLKAMALRAHGQADEAREILVEGRAVAEKIGLHRELWPILSLLGDLAAARGDNAEARALRQSAQEHLHFISSNITESALRASFLGQPRVQAARHPG